MPNYIIECWKNKLAELHQELNALKSQEPSEENLARVNEIEKNAKGITLAIRQYKQAHGMAA